MKVVTPSGVWHVRRRWAPRRLGRRAVWERVRHRTRRDRGPFAELAPFADPDLASGFVAAALVVVSILFLIVVGVPFLIALGELLLVAVLAGAAAAGRVLFRRPWTVDAVDAAGVHHEWPVVGWQRSGAARRFVADHVAACGTAPTDEDVAAALRAG